MTIAANVLPSAASGFDCTQLPPAIKWQLIKNVPLAIRFNKFVRFVNCREFHWKDLLSLRDIRVVEARGLGMSRHAGRLDREGLRRAAQSLFFSPILSTSTRHRRSARHKIRGCAASGINKHIKFRQPNMNRQAAMKGKTSVDPQSKLRLQAVTVAPPTLEKDCHHHRCTRKRAEPPAQDEGSFA